MNMVFKKKNVSIKVDPTFFEKSFEPSRRALEKQLGTRVTQGDFTSMLQRSGVKLNVNLKELGVRNVRKNKNKK